MLEKLRSIAKLEAQDHEEQAEQLESGADEDERLALIHDSNAESYPPSVEHVFRASANARRERADKQRRLAEAHRREAAFLREAPRLQEDVLNATLDAVNADKALKALLLQYETD